MAITQANLKIKIAAYINRTAAELVISSYDLILDAMNMAKLGAQRKHDFKMCRTRGFIQTSLLGAQMSTITSDAAATTPIVMKSLEAMGTYTTDGSGNTHWAQNVTARTSLDERLYHPNVNSWAQMANVAVPPGSVVWQTSQQLWWQEGTMVYVSGLTAASPFMVKGFQYLPDYDGTSGTNDFFLTYHHDWLFVASLDYMNLFLKEDQRIQISSTKMEQLWNAVVSYDESFSESAADLDASD